MDISSVTSQSNIGGISQPVIGQRKIEHEIRLKDGEPSLLGGMFEDQDIKSLSGIPGLSQIPLLKYLFSETDVEHRRNEIVFVLIPHIVRGPEYSDLNQTALEIGTGTAIDIRRWQCRYRFPEQSGSNRYRHCHRHSSRQRSCSGAAYSST